MSMLRCFFEIGADSSLFDGLYISQKRELCEKYMGKFPVLFLSLKNVDGLTFENARYHLTELVGREASRQTSFSIWFSVTSGRNERVV